MTFIFNEFIILKSLFSLNWQKERGGSERPWERDGKSDVPQNFTQSVTITVCAGAVSHDSVLVSQMVGWSTSTLLSSPAPQDAFAGSWTRSQVARSWTSSPIFDADILSNSSTHNNINLYQDINVIVYIKAKFRNFEFLKIKSYSNALREK